MHGDWINVNEFRMRTRAAPDLREAVACLAMLEGLFGKRTTMKSLPKPALKRVPQQT